MAGVIRTKKVSGDIQKILYKDFVSTLAFNVDTKDLIMITNEDAIKQSLINIILINKGERHFNPTFGSDLNRLLFENISPQTTSALKDVITYTIENFEPRVRLVNIVVSPSPDENYYSISIVFSIINKTEPISLDFILYRVR